MKKAYVVIKNGIGEIKVVPYYETPYVPWVTFENYWEAYALKVKIEQGLVPPEARFFW